MTTHPTITLDEAVAMPEGLGIVLGFTEDGTALVDHYCEGPIRSLEQGETVYGAEQMRSYAAAQVQYLMADLQALLTIQKNATDAAVRLWLAAAAGKDLS